MGYYANGSGTMTFMCASDAKLKEVGNLLSDAWFEYTVENVSSEGKYTIDFYADNKYHGDEIDALLAAIAQLVSMTDGELAYVGEDGEHWRFVYKPADMSWHEQNGYIVYEDT